MNSKVVARIFMLLLLLAAAAWALAHRETLSVEALRGHLHAFGALAPLVYMASYSIATVLFLPGSVFTLAGGVLFGPWLGALYALIGATVGASAAFLIARYLASGWVARRVRGGLRRLIEGVEQEGWRFVAFVRLVPVFPFNLLNYALGLTRIPTVQYAVASFVCMAPGALAYAWIGHAGAKAVAGGAGTIRAMLVALALLACLLFLPRLVRRIWRGGHNESMHKDSGP
ncbi:MAG: TVP38/TMEM64 family protein [Nitrococcus sp.]|nr:TVP38/TMEM64 family protein [Nitrococcus sp.]